MAEWFAAIDAGDWLGAGVNGLSILVAILLGIVFGPMVAERGARRDRQETLLRTLVETWLIPALPNYNTAINLIPIEFRSALKVMTEYRSYMDQVSLTPDAEGAETHERTTRERQAKLIEAIARHLGYPVTAHDLLTRSYISSGFVERERLLHGAQFAWLRMAAALERMAPATTAPADNAAEAANASQSSDTPASGKD